MNQVITRLFIILGALITFFCGIYGIIDRNPTRLFNEIMLYCGISLFTLFPLLLLCLLARKSPKGNFLLCIGGLSIGIFGGYIYLWELVYSNEPSWGFSIILSPAAQVICVLALCAIIAIYRKI